MSNSTRFLRHLTDGPRCFVCGYVEEIARHILMECPVARILWNKLGLHLRPEDHSLNFPDWLMRNLQEGVAGMGSEWPRVFATTCWWLWRWRNDRSFNRSPNIPLDQVSFIFLSVGEIKKAMDRMQQCQGSKKGGRQKILVTWSCP